MLDRSGAVMAARHTAEMGRATKNCEPNAVRQQLRRQQEPSARKEPARNRRQGPTCTGVEIELTGSDDIPRPVHEGQQMAAILDCPFVEIAGAGHISTLEAPEPVTERLARFLAEALGGTARRAVG